MRIILGCDKYTKIETMLHQLNWLKVAELTEVNALIFIHKIRLNIVPEYFNNVIIQFRDIHYHNTRFKNNISLEYKNTKRGQNNLFFKAALIYNKLPESIKDIDSVKKFSLKLKEYYLNPKSKIS